MSSEADLILVNGKIFTLDSKNTIASSVAIKGNLIVAVGDDMSVKQWIGPKTTTVALHGRTVMPGLVDTHCHISSVSDPAPYVDCRDFYTSVSSVSDIQRLLRTYAVEHPTQSIVVGVGSPMQEFRLHERRRPFRMELDEAVPGLPAYITFGAHVLVANSQSLARAGITSDTRDPHGGMIERDAHGYPTGVLYERAQLLVKRSREIGRTESYKEALRRNLLLAAARGATTIHDIVTSSDAFWAYQSLEREGRLPVRVHLIFRVVDSQFERYSLLDLGIQPGFGNEMLQIGGVKISVDGGFTARQGLFYEIDNEPKGNRPLMRIDQESLNRVVRDYHNAGMRICVHAIGDRAMDMVLESYELAIGAEDRKDHRHRIEHMGNWLLTDERRRRARLLGVTPVPNPSFLYYLGANASETLHERRMENPLPARSLLDSGFVLAFGSDGPSYWPVDPLRDASFCTSRKASDGTELAPGQAISRLEAMHAITKAGAWLGFMENRLGTVESGRLADLVVLERNPFTVDPQELGLIGVDMTIVDGQVVDVVNLSHQDSLQRSIDTD